MPFPTLALYKETMTKPDGRRLILYGRKPIQVGSVPNPRGERPAASSHFRWHPFRGEWVAYAAHRSNRTFLPSVEYNPLAPTTQIDKPTELPAGIYDVAVFENRFPVLQVSSETPPRQLTGTRAGGGVSEVVVYTQESSGSLGALPLDHLGVVLEAWADRYQELGRRPDIHYVMPFENRGIEVGVTLHHPHGQIYAFPFVPPIPAEELRRQADFLHEHGHGLLAAHVQVELKDGRRILYDGPHAVAFVPSFARYAYEGWVAPKRAVPSLLELTSDEHEDFARALKTLLLKYDRLWNRPFPYVMVLHQAPTDGAAHPEAHLHIECYPPYRMPDRLKYLAGSELGAGLFAADTLPEEKAAELQAVQVSIE